MTEHKVDIMPMRGTESYRWWERGAQAEHDAIHEGMTEDNKELFNYVKIMAQQGSSANEIADHVASIFTCEWPMRRRVALAWEIAKPLSWRRWTAFRWLRDGLKDLWSIPNTSWAFILIVWAAAVFGGYAIAWWLR